MVWIHLAQCIDDVRGGHNRAVSRRAFQRRMAARTQGGRGGRGGIGGNTNVCRTCA